MEKPPISMIEVQLRSFVESLRPADEETRKQLDVGYSWDGQTALLFEIRPQWNDPTKILELPFARIRLFSWITSNGQLKRFSLGRVFPIANAVCSQFDAENKCLYIRTYCGV